MIEVAEFPDAVEWLSDYLERGLRVNGYPNARVSDKFRGDRVEVWLQRDGGPVLDVVREIARIRVNCFHDASTDDAVDALAQRVSSLVRIAPRTLNSPVKDVDVRTGPTPIDDLRPRRYMLFELTMRGVSVTLNPF